MAFSEVVSDIGQELPSTNAQGDQVSIHPTPNPWNVWPRSRLS